MARTPSTAAPLTSPPPRLRIVANPEPPDALELQTLDISDLLEDVSEDDEVLVLDDADIDVVLDIAPDDLDPPTEDIEDFLVATPKPQERAPDESQQRPRLRRSWIAMTPGNTNASLTPAIEEPTRAYRPRGPMPSLPRFPLLPLPPRPAASAPLPSFPLLPVEPPRPSIPKGPPVRLPRFSLPDVGPALPRPSPLTLHAHGRRLQ